MIFSGGAFFSFWSTILIFSPLYGLSLNQLAVLFFSFLNLNGGLLFGLYDVVRIDFLLVIRTCSVNSLLPYLLELFHRTAFRPSSISLSLSLSQLFCLILMFP